jgi:hypothetical protein
LSLSKEKATDLDFEVFREPWNKYSLKDKSNVRGRVVLQKVLLKETLRPDGTVDSTKKGYQIDAQTITVVYNVPKELMGEPSNQGYSIEALQAAIVQSDIGYDTIFQEWNEYIVEDGTKIRMQLLVTRVDRTSLHDKYGNPVYLIQTALNTTITPRAPK